MADKKRKAIVPLSPDGGAIIPAEKLEAHRREFERPAREVTISEVFDYYKKSGEKNKVSKETMLPILSIQSRLPSLLSKYNTLDAARDKSGYRQAVEEMERVVYGMLSFQKGFQNLRACQEKYDVDYKLVKMLRQYYGKRFDDGEETSRDLASSLTSEEMTWLSVVGKLPGLLVEHPMSSVPAIVDYFYDGVEWALDTLKYSTDSENARDTYDVAGVTGARSDTQFSPFVPKFELAMKGLYLGLVSDTHIFEQCFEDLQMAALVSGDGKILRAFATRDGCALDDRYALKVRDRVNEFLSGLAILNLIKGSVMSSGDTVRLIGMLEFIPSCFFDQRTIAMIPSGKGMMFLDPSNLAEIAYVPYDPFVGHIAQNEVYHGMNSIDREAPVWRLLFAKIRQKIREKNQKEGHETKLETLAREIKEKYGIEVRTSVEKYDVAKELLFLKSKKIDYSVKMGFWDLYCVSQILSDLPKKYLSRIKVIERRADGDIYSDMLYGLSHVGTFEISTGRLRLVIPPVKSDERLGSSSLRYSLTIAHEVGHSVYFAEDTLVEKWSKLSKADHKFPRKERRGHFLTPYASTEPEEDFAECFACYIVFGDEFKELAKKHPVLAKKYELMKGLFDGREFEQRTEGKTIESVTGNLLYDFNVRVKLLSNETQSDEALGAAILRRQELEALKSVGKPLEGPSLDHKGAGGKKHAKKGATPHVRTWMNPSGLVSDVLFRRLGPQMAAMADVNEIVDWLITGYVDKAVIELANETGLSKKVCKKAIDECHVLMRQLQSEIESTDEAIEDANKERKDPRNET